MPVVNGTYTPTNLTAIQLEIKKILGTDNSISRMYGDTDAKTLKGLMAIQQAKIKFSEEKEQNFDILWYEKVNNAISNSGITNCEFTGTSGGTDKQTLNLDGRASDTFKVDNLVERTNMITEEEEVAQNLIQTFSKLAIELNTRAIAFLEANKGTAVATLTGLTSDADGIDVPTARYNSLLMADILRIIQMNKIKGASLVTGGTMWNNYFNAESRAATDDKNDELKRFGGLNWIFDIDGLGADADEPIYLASPFAYAFAHKVRNTFPSGSIRLNKKGDRGFYRMENPFIKGLFHEITERYECLDNSQDVTYYGIDTWFKGFLNPKSVNYPNNTGIFKMLKVA